MNITLCGSAKFEWYFRTWDRQLTLAGHTVYGLAVYPNWYTEEQKAMLDRAHLCKIYNSQCILVLNVDGYIGDSTKREIAFARSRYKRVFWLTKIKGQANLEDGSVDDLMQMNIELPSSLNCIERFLDLNPLPTSAAAPSDVSLPSAPAESLLP